MACFKLPVLFFLLAADVALGSVAGIIRKNQCQSPTFFQPFYEATGARFEDWETYYYSSPDNPYPHRMESSLGPYEVPPGTAVFSHYHLPTYGGVSEKFTAEAYNFNALPQNSPHVQLEYTAGEREIWFDLSFINCHNDADQRGGCLFRGGGYLVEFEDMEARECPHIYCAPTSNENVECRNAYFDSDDDHATTTCRKGEKMYDEVNMTLTFCPTQDQLNRYSEKLARRGSAIKGDVDKTRTSDGSLEFRRHPSAL